MTVWVVLFWRKQRHTPTPTHTHTTKNGGGVMVVNDLLIQSLMDQFHLRSQVRGRRRRSTGTHNTLIILLLFVVVFVVGCVKNLSTIFLLCYNTREVAHFLVCLLLLLSLAFFIQYYYSDLVIFFFFSENLLTKLKIPNNNVCRKAGGRQRDVSY